jgi:PKD repeat protein/photosystem II stability/assembly factor-like uncharacterized protein
MPTLGVSAIVVDYSNPSVIFMGTGDRDAGDAPGLGVYKSTDGGMTWTASKTGMGDKTVGKIIQHPTSSLIFLAATSGGIYRSTDGCANWTQTRTGNFKDICFKPGDPNIVYAASAADFYRSTNNGTSFTQITSGLTAGQRGAIAVTAANVNYVYFVQSNTSSGFKGLYRSTDAGLNFTTRSTTPNILDWSCNGSGTGGQGWYDLAIVADPNNAETIYVGGVDVWKSTNGGTSWTINSHWYGGCGVPAVHADCHYLGYSPVNGTLYAGNDGGIYYTTNGGTNWTDITVGMTIGQIYKLGQSQTERDQTINGFQDNGTYTRYPTGWEATGGGDGMECWVDYLNKSYMYHTIYYGDIYRTYNNGTEYHIAGNGINGITESGAWVTPFLLSRPDPKVMFVGYKNIWRCMDVQASSITWTRISNNLGGSNSNNLAVLAQSPVSNQVLYAARWDNKLFRSDNAMDASPAWTDLTTNLPAAGTPSDLSCHPTDVNVVYMTMGNSVYRSPDKGLSWTNITGSLPAVSKNSIVCYKNAPEGLYVGTDAGVYYKDYIYTTWQSFNVGLPVSVLATELDIYYDNDSVSRDAIRACTYGRGLWGSDMFVTYAADFIADSTSVCQGQNVDFTDQSTATPTSWSWTFTGGTPSSSTAQNPQDIVYANSGTYPVSLTVYYGSTFNVSVTKNSYITVYTPTPAPQQPSGDTLLCENNPGTIYTTYSVPGATGYTWDLSPSAAGVLTAMDTSVLVDWNDTWTGYALLKVAATGFCGTSAWSPDLQVHVRPFPDIPGTPDGPALFCQGTASTVYTISPAANATSYEWKLDPSSAGTITGTDTAGTVTWNSSFSGIADVSVKAINDCNISAYSNPLTVTVNPLPVVFLGPDTTLCDFQTILLDAGNPGSMYLWSDGSTTQTILVDSTGTGYGTANRSVLVTTPYGCQGSDDINITFTICQGIVTGPSGWNVAVYPNPNNGRFMLGISLPGTETMDIHVLNLLGLEVFARKDQVVHGKYSSSFDLTGIREGIYYLVLKSKNNRMVIKVVVQK